MMLAGIFGGILFLTLVLGDWHYFSRLSPEASRYGFTVGRRQDVVEQMAWDKLDAQFGPTQLLRLPHGIARLFVEERRIVLRPLSVGFRTAWPLKGSIEVECAGGAARLVCHKRVPWSSAVLTFLWFVLVGGGTVAFLAAFLINGGFTSLSGVLMGLGIAGLGTLVFLFGLVIVALAYRLEDQRLAAVYGELLGVIPGRNAAP